MKNDSYCSQCEEWLVKQFIEQGIARACPLCSQIYHVAEYIAESPVFPYEVRQGAEGLSDLAKGIGVIALLVMVFDQPKRRRR